MLDRRARARIDPALDAIAAKLSKAGISANAMTLVACGVGLGAGLAIAHGAFWLALLLILISRLGDGLDGAIAAIRGRTDFGGFLDIVLDFVFYGVVPLGFIIHDPHANAIAGAVLLLSFYVNGGSVLAFAIMAEKRGLPPEGRAGKSLLFTTGLMEATETLIFFVAFCLMPGWFAPFAYVFAALCFYTALSRIVLAARSF